MGRKPNNGRRRRKRSVAFANPEATTFGEGDGNSASGPMPVAPLPSGQPMQHAGRGDPFAGLNLINTAPAPLHGSFQRPLSLSVASDSVPSTHPFAALNSLNAAPSSSTPATQQSLQFGLSGDSLSSNNTFPAVNNHIVQSNVAPSSFIRPSILKRTPAPSDPFSGLIQVKMPTGSPRAGDHFARLSALRALPSGPPPPPRKRRRHSLANPPPVDAFMTLNELRMAPSTPPLPLAELPRSGGSILGLRARDPIEEPLEPGGQPIVITASPAQTRTVPTLPSPCCNPFANLLALNEPSLAKATSNVSPLPPSIAVAHSDSSVSGELKESAIALAPSTRIPFRPSIPMPTSHLNPFFKANGRPRHVEPMHGPLRKSGLSPPGDGPAASSSALAAVDTIEGDTIAPLISGNDHFATPASQLPPPVQSTTPTGVLALSNDVGTGDMAAIRDASPPQAEGASSPRSQLRQQWSGDNVLHPSALHGEHWPGDETGDLPADTSSDEPLKPRHCCPPSFRLDCQIVDLMYGAQLAGAQRVNHLDRGIEALNRVMDATDTLKRTFQFRVANSWVAYNQVLLETADDVFAP